MLKNDIALSFDRLNVDNFEKLVENYRNLKRKFAQYKK